MLTNAVWTTLINGLQMYDLYHFAYEVNAGTCWIFFLIWNECHENVKHIVEDR